MKEKGKDGHWISWAVHGSHAGEWLLLCTEDVVSQKKGNQQQCGLRVGWAFVGKPGRSRLRGWRLGHTRTMHWALLAGLVSRLVHYQAWAKAGLLWAENWALGLNLCFNWALGLRKDLGLG